MPPVQPNMAKKICHKSCKRLPFQAVRFALLGFWFLIFLDMQTHAEALDFCFDGSKEGHRLETDVIKTIHAKSGVDCISECLRQDESCRSVNFKKYSTCERNCELLSAIDSEKPAERLMKDDDFDYYKLLRPDRKPREKTIEPLSSCNELLEKNRFLTDGVYKLRNNVSNEEYEVYCNMTEQNACGPGGWTLVIKMDGNKQETKGKFTYHSPLWTTKESYAVDNGLEGPTMKETKLASYWNTPFSKMCLGMTINGDTRFLTVEYQASSLYSAIADGQPRSTSAGREAWRTLVAGSSLQPFCNQEGFNIAYQKFKVRIGLYANNQNSCGFADSTIGFGITYEACGVKSNITCGNIAQCGSTDNGSKLTAAFGYILVQ